MKRLWLWSYKPPVDCCWRIPVRCKPVTGPGPLINIPGPIVWTYWKPLEDPLRSSPGPFHWLGPPPLLNWLLTDSCSSGRIIDWYQFSHIKMGSYRLKTAGPKPIQSKKKTKRKFPTGGKGQHFCAPEGEAGGQRRGGGVRPAIVLGPVEDDNIDRVMTGRGSGGDSLSGLESDRLISVLFTRECLRLSDARLIATSSTRPSIDSSGSIRTALMTFTPSPRLLPGTAGTALLRLLRPSAASSFCGSVALSFLCVRPSSALETFLFSIFFFSVSFFLFYFSAFHSAPVPLSAPIQSHTFP